MNSKKNIDDEPGFVDLLGKMAKEGSWRELLASEHGTSSLCFDLKCSHRVLSPDVFRKKKKVREAKSPTENLSEAGAQ